MTVDNEFIKNTNLPHDVSLDTTMERCKALLVGIENIHEQADTADVIGDVLEIISHEYYLVPKVSIGEKGEFIENTIPDKTITQSLSELWSVVSN